MTKTHKQLILIGVLASVLVAVWPRTSTQPPDTVTLDSPEIHPAAAIAVSPNSNTPSNPMRGHEDAAPSRASPPTRPAEMIKANEPNAAVVTPSQTWTLDDLLAHDFTATTIQRATDSIQGSDKVQAVYWSELPVDAAGDVGAGVTANAGAVIGDEVIRPGQVLPGRRRVIAVQADGVRWSGD